MSSGDSETPPTYYFSGITFNPSFYTSDYITKETGKKYFLSYPIAQGTETISTLIASTINSSASNDTVNLFNNITSGTLYVGTGLLNGFCNIASTLSTGTLNLGNTTGTAANLLGNVVIGNDSNNSTSANNGTCQINKLKVGVNGTPYRYMIMQNSIGAGLSGVQTVTIPNAPSNMGLPIVFACFAFIDGGNLTNLYYLNYDVLTYNTFRYRKRLLNGTTYSDISVEAISYVAYWM